MRWLFWLWVGLSVSVFCYFNFYLYSSKYGLWFFFFQFILVLTSCGNIVRSFLSKTCMTCVFVGNILQWHVTLLMRPHCIVSTCCHVLVSRCKRYISYWLYTVIFHGRIKKMSFAWHGQAVAGTGCGLSKTVWLPVDVFRDTQDWEWKLSCLFSGDTFFYPSANTRSWEVKWVVVSVLWQERRKHNERGCMCVIEYFKQM